MDELLELLEGKENDVNFLEVVDTIKNLVKEGRELNYKNGEKDDLRG